MPLDRYKHVKVLQMAIAYAVNAFLQNCDSKQKDVPIALYLDMIHVQDQQDFAHDNAMGGL